MSSSSSSQNFVAWTDHESSVLKSSVAQYRQQDINWEFVASRIPSRSAGSCRARWDRMLAKGAIRGDRSDRARLVETSSSSVRWSDQELQTLTDLNKRGLTFDEISRLGFQGERSASACRNRHNVLVMKRLSQSRATDVKDSPTSHEDLIPDSDDQSGEPEEEEEEEEDMAEIRPRYSKHSSSHEKINKRVRFVGIEIPARKKQKMYRTQAKDDDEEDDDEVVIVDDQVFRLQTSLLSKVTTVQAVQKVREAPSDVKSLKRALSALDLEMAIGLDDVRAELKRVLKFN